MLNFFFLLDVDSIEEDRLVYQYESPQEVLNRTDDRTKPRRL